MFKTLGAAFGGMIGGAIGAVLGGVGTPFGVLLGEIVGEFIGDTLYDMFNGDEEGTKGVALLKKKFGELLTGAGKAGKAIMGFAMGILTKAGNFFKDGFDRFIEDFPTLNISKIPGVPSGLRWASNNVPMLSFLKKYQDSGNKNKVNVIPDFSLLTPFGLPRLIPHLKNSFFPSGEEEQVQEASISGGEETDDEFTSETTTQQGGLYAVKYYDKEGNEIDPLSSEAENLKKEAVNMLKGEEISSNESASSNVSAVSTHASYEGSEAGTVVLTKPDKKNYTGRSGQKRYEQAMIMYNNQKEMLNSYQKTQVKANLAKI